MAEKADRYTDRLIVGERDAYIDREGEREEERKEDREIERENQRERMRERERIYNFFTFPYARTLRHQVKNTQ